AMRGQTVRGPPDSPTAERLVKRALPSDPVAATCLYFASQERLYNRPRLLLNANPGAFVNHAIQLTNLSPAYAPSGQHLLSATLLGIPELSDDELVRRCREDIASWFPGKDLTQ